jgi:primosomal protein N' (replication factor Y) (superfamily II helicase)
MGYKAYKIRRTLEFNLLEPQIKSSSTITLVPLGTTFLHGSLISHELTELLSIAREREEKVLILYNRRGSGRAWICQDCGYFPLCPHCDIALAYHTSPKKQLICHQCSYTTYTSGECQKCHGMRFHPVGVGIQKITEDIETIFPDSHILRADSDAEIEKKNISHAISDIDIIIGTYAHLSLLHHSDIAHIVFLLFESELTLPDYRMEEDTYHTIEYAKKSGKHLFIQTYTPEHPFLSLIIEGNYRDFLSSMSHEREKYQYPPYAQFALIRIRDIQKEKVRDIMTKLVNKIAQIKSDDIFIASDQDIWERYSWEWVQKIILKWKNLDILLANFEVEIVRNRAVTLEWR